MSPDIKQMEFDKVINLTRSFGYEINSSSIEGEKIKVECEKIFKTGTSEQKRYELDRITSVLKSLGWEKKSDSVSGDKINARFEKVIKIEV